MNKVKKRNYYIGIAVALLIFSAVCCRFLARSINNEFIDKLLNFIRTFIYIGLLAFWGISVNKRVIQLQVRRMLSTVSVLMLLWLIVREFKWRFVVSSDVSRYLWYMYYIPILLIPMFALFISMSLGKPEDYRLPKRISLLYIVAGILVTLVLTNDFHQLVFDFPENAFVWTEFDYRYNSGFFLTVIFGILCSVSAFAVMLTKCRLQNSRRFLWMPMLPFCVCIVYIFLYAINSPVIGFITDLAVFYCLMFAAFFEICINCGLIQSNTRYYDLFRASVDTPAQITDKDYNVYYAAKSAEPFHKDTMRTAEDKPLILPEGKRLHNMSVCGGHAVWTEDISELIELRERLEDRQEELRDRGALLQYEYEREKKHKIVEEQNRLYDLLQSKTQKQIDKIECLVLDYRKAQSRVEKQKILAYIVILGSFIKRRKDFVLSLDSTPIIPESKLVNAFRESFRALRLINIQGSFIVHTGKDYISGTLLTRAYDFFEDILEAVLGQIHFLNVSVCPVGGVLRIRILTDLAGCTENFSREYPQIKIIHEDSESTSFILPLTGGAER